MNNREIARYGLSCLIKAGADKAQCVLAKSEKRELNVEAGKFSLIRTTYDSNMNYKAIKDNRGGITRSQIRQTKIQLNRLRLMLLKLQPLPSSIMLTILLKSRSRRSSIQGVRSRILTGCLTGYKPLLNQ